MIKIHARLAKESNKKSETYIKVVLFVSAYFSCVNLHFVLCFYLVVPGSIFTDFFVYLSTQLVEIILYYTQIYHQYVHYGKVTLL